MFELKIDLHAQQNQFIFLQTGVFSNGTSNGKILIL